MDFIECLKDKLTILQDNLVKQNFKACANMSTDIIRASEFIGFPDGIFLGEFFESAFGNISIMHNAFDVEKEHTEKIITDMASTIEFVRDNIPLKSVDVKAKLFDSLMKTRFTVTSLQVKYFREKKPKKGRFPMSMPISPVELVEEEQD